MRATRARATLARAIRVLAAALLASTPAPTAAATTTTTTTTRLPELGNFPGAGAPEKFPNLGGTAATAATVCVGIVVDFGDALLAPASTRTCLDLPPNASGSDVLAARATTLGRPPPRYDGAFVCGIDGYPADGCGNESGATHYWSYWHHASGGWRYADTGATQSRVTDTDQDGHPDMEGWRYTSITGAAQTPPITSYDEVCPDAPEPSRSTATPSGSASTRRTPAPTTRTPQATGSTPPTKSGGASPTPRSTTATPSGTDVASPMSPVAVANPPMTPRRGRPVLPAVAGLALAAAVAGAAVNRTRRDRRDPS